MASEREVYHTREEYEAQQLRPFLDHIRAYFICQRTVPVSRADSSMEGIPSVTFTFSNDLLQEFLQNYRRMRKPYEVAVKYGFRGYSLGERNGIFYQRDEDQAMLRATDRLLVACQRELEQDLETRIEDLGTLKKVKIVWHNPSGERIVGAYNPHNNRVLFAGFASY